MIVRDVAGFIESCLDSVIDECDEVIITDTGSVDDTLKILERYLPAHTKNWKILKYTPETNPESFLLDNEDLGRLLGIPGPYSNEWILGDFGGARQFGWEKATSDYLLWIDSDDLVKNAKEIKRTLGTLKSENIPAALINYEYATNDAGQVICTLKRERVVRRGSGVWRHPIHEIIAISGPSRIFDSWQITHRRNEIRKTQKPKIEFRNLKVLLSRYEKEKAKKYIDPRLLFYLGMEMRGLSMDRAEPIIEDYLKRSDWDEERSVAWAWLGEIAESRGNHFVAFQRYAAAAVEFPSRPEGLFGGARSFYFRALDKVKNGLGAILDWQKCTELTERGYETMRMLWPKQGILQCNPTERLYRPLTFVSKAYIDSGRVKEGMEAAENALKINAANKEMQTNVRICQEWFDNAQKTQNTKELSTVPTQMDGPNALEMKKIAENSPDGSTGPEENTKNPKKDVEAQEGFTGTAPSSPAEALDIVIWTGSAWETWSPHSLDTGIGGSETAAIHIARCLKELGHRVRVLSDCKHLAGTYNGVEYIHFEEARKGAIECDVLIVSRQIAAVDLPIEAKIKILWVHDIHVGAWNAEFERRILKVDKIFCLSKWHRNDCLAKTYPCLPFEKYHVTRNGIDPSRFGGKQPKKIGNRLIYTSSGNRGLDRLLDLFPRIRQEVKDAELHVYYGFDTWISMAKAYRNEKELASISALQEKMKKTDGVVGHGRVGQRELAEAFMAAKVWAYPTSFTETSCISAIEAQAAECVPVTTNLAALSETVKYGILIPPLGGESIGQGLRLYNRTERAYDDSFVKEVVSLLTHETVRASYGHNGREFALDLHHHWKTIAKEWIVVFEQILREKALNSLPPYFIEMNEAPRTVLR
jgi:glycosyltransferase involved in cell wall biosynthesis